MSMSNLTALAQWTYQIQLFYAVFCKHICLTSVLNITVFVHTLFVL